MKMEVLRKNGKKDGIEKRYLTTGILVVEFPYKMVKEYDEISGKLKLERSL